MLRDENYYQVSGWMLTKLKLKGNELHAFALIYGFCQDGRTRFTGSLRYLGEWLGASRSTTINTLKKLCEKELLIKHQKEINNVTFNSYSVNMEILNSFGQKNSAAGPTPAATEKENDLNVKKSIPSKVDVFKNYAGDDAELLALLSDFEDMRKRTRTTMTAHAKKLLVKKLDRDFPTREDKIATLEQSIERSYRSIFPVGKKQTSTKAQQYDYSWGVEGRDYL